MPPTTRKRARVLAGLREIENEPPLAYDSDVYDSDECLDQPLPQRVSAKLKSAMHAAEFDLDDEEGWYPRDDEYDILSAEPNLEDLSELLVEVEEAIIWWKESDARHGSASDVEVLCGIYRDAKKHDEVIGPRLLLELKMNVDTYVAIYRGLEKHRDALATTLLVRRVRTSNTAEGRATRCVPTEHTTGEALVVWLERLKQRVDAALVRCGERV
jgi:hypothetical protein